jgi:hypothetical protein
MYLIIKNYLSILYPPEAEDEDEGKVELLPHPSSQSLSHAHTQTDRHLRQKHQPLTHPPTFTLTFALVSCIRIRDDLLALHYCQR